MQAKNTSESEVLDAEQTAKLADFLIRYPAAAEMPFESVALATFAGTVAEMPPAFWTIGPAGSLITVGGRR